MTVDPDDLALAALGEAVDHAELTADEQETLADWRRVAAAARSVGPEDRTQDAPPAEVWDGIAAALAADAAAGNAPIGAAGADDVAVEPIAAAGADDAAVEPIAAEPGAAAARVGAATAEEADVDELAQRRSRRLPRWVVPAVLGAAAAAAVIVPLAAVMTRDGAGDEVVAEVELEPRDVEGTATAQLLDTGDGQIVRVSIDGATAGPDEFLEVWLLDEATGELFSLGPERTDQRYAVPDGLVVADVPFVDISREPADGDPGHSGQTIFRGQLPLDTV